MQKYTKRKNKASGCEVKYTNGKRVTKYFHLYCDVCGLRYGDRGIIAHELCEEEGFPEGDYCEECQFCMREQGFVGEDESIYFLKKDYPK